MLRILLLWALLAPAAAQVYKWVDEKGVTHYGERPPQGRKANEVEQRLANPAAPGKAAQPDWKEQEIEFNKRRIKSEQTESRNKEREANQRHACEQARYQLNRIKSANRLYRLDEKGERVYQSEEERSAAMARLEQQVAERCR